MYVVAILPAVEIATLWWLLLALNAGAALSVVAGGGLGRRGEPASGRSRSPAPATASAATARNNDPTASEER